jgi:hypothetical protein
MDLKNHVKLQSNARHKNLPSATKKEKNARGATLSNILEGIQFLLNLNKASLHSISII